MDPYATKLRAVPLADIELPKELSGLRRLAYNLWWTWNSQARQLFSHIYPALWAIYRNPVELLINIDPHHWETLLADDLFLGMYRSVLRDFDAYLKTDHNTWFGRNYPQYQGGPIVYFSTEFGFHESLHTYSGGLGVLSGDHCKSASDLGLPFLAVGPLYHHGYFEQEVEPDGRQQHFYPAYDFSRLPVQPLLGEDGRQLHVDVDLKGRRVYVRVWLAQIGRVHALLLDTDNSRNDPADRPITGQLYVGGREMRICQEIVLGIGGVRVLQALGIEPACWHMNEGHCAFLGLERIRQQLQTGKSFEQAREFVSRNSVFTTHTPVPAGNEQFETALVRQYFERFCTETGIGSDQLLRLGLSEPDRTDQPFNLTVLAIQLSRYCNGVSQLHGKVSSEMWRHLYPKAKAGEQPIKAITNGIHTETWLGQPLRELFDRYLTPAWRENLMDEMFWKRGIPNLPDADLWDIHQMQKETLLRFVRTRLREQLARHGCSPDELREIETLLDPDILTIGFARRFATYKRADLLLRDFDRLRALIQNKEFPVQLIFAGKAHPMDRPGQELIRRIFEISRHSDLRGRLVFVENYNMRAARMLVQGVDVWLNTPRRPHEASGTSGMKAATNGAPNLSIADGWWCEAAQEGENGWTIGTSQSVDNPDQQDAADSLSLYELLEEEVVPRYYQRDAAGVHTAWLAMMKSAMATIVPRFSTARMVRDYLREAYLPAARRGGARISDTDTASW